MGVKSEKARKDNGLEYPALMIGAVSGVVVLMRGYARGTVVHKSGSTVHDIGEYSSTWSMESFEPFTGTITLSND